MKRQPTFLTAEILPLGRAAVFLASAFALALLASSSRADWPQFLGANRDGKPSPDDKVKLIHSFSGEGAKFVWKHKVGEGFAGPVVAHGRVFIFHRVGDDAILESLDVKSGERVWVFRYKTPYKDSFGFDEGPRSPPTIDAGQVFLYGAEGVLHCVDEKTGELQWKADLVKEYESSQGFFGRSSAPLVTGDQVLVCAGGTSNGKRAAVLAFDRQDGKLRWQGIDDEADYASPVLAKFHGLPTAVCFLRTGLTLVDPSNGATLDSERFRSRIHASVNAASPVVLPDNHVLLSSCYDVGAGLWEVTPKQKLREVWKHQDRLDCHYATPVATSGHLFGFHGRQESGTELRCLRISDGEVRWASDRLPAGSLILADGKLVVLTENGELRIVRANPDKFEQTGSGQVLGAGTRALPALSNGFFYARDKRQLVCVDLRAE